MLTRTLLFHLLFAISSISFAQQPLYIPVDNISELIRGGSAIVQHSTLDIGSIHDVFDLNDQTLARSANINPLVITLMFKFPVTYSGSRILHTGGDGWWTLEGANSLVDLELQTGSYIRFFSQSPLIDAVPDTNTFSTHTHRFFRLTVSRTTGDDYVHLNDWQLLNATGVVDIVSICTRPSELWLIPDASVNVSLYGEDEQGMQYLITEDMQWMLTEEDVDIELLDNGSATLFSTDSLLNTGLEVQWSGLTTLISVHVVDDFAPLPATQRTVRVALVIIDPPIEAEGGMRFHERFGWENPADLAARLADSLDAVSGGVVDYEITATYDEDFLFAAFEGLYISVDSMYRLFLEPGWETFHMLEQSGGVLFDYNFLLAAHDLCTQSNNGEIDEVWVYSMPFTGMYESRLAGDGAFWYNAPPLDGNNCTDHLPIMGLNYERGLAEAMHSFGHRVESAMAHAFGRWDYNASPQNDWERFAAYDLEAPGFSHVGNIHFPPNATSDYDYSNPSTVTSFAGNWRRYPFLFSETKQIKCEEWDCSHLGYMSWWFRHLPHFTCKNKDGLLNNWWSYIVDYNEAKLLEKETPNCGCYYVQLPTAIHTIGYLNKIKVYPNPASDHIRIEIGDAHDEMIISLIDSSGKEIKTQRFEKDEYDILIDVRKVVAGSYQVVFKDVRGKIRGVHSVNIVR